MTTRPGEILAGASSTPTTTSTKRRSQTVIPAHLSEEKLDEVKPKPARPIWR